MTTELEKQFFDTFGIKKIFKPEFDEMYPDFKSYSLEYPQITDRILLELICVVGNYDYFLITNEGQPIDVSGLKNSVLHLLTIYLKQDKTIKENLKPQVQALFKE